jgi:hypothetical protein
MNFQIKLAHAQELPAQKVLVTGAKLQGGSFELHRYEGDGEENLSSSSGPGFAVAGGSLKEIFTKLWPDYEFKVSRKFDKNSYTLRVNYTTALDKSILDQIWNLLGQHKDFSATKSSVTLSGNCLNVISTQKLEQHVYIPKNGVIKKDESNRSQIHLDGYDLVSLVNKLNQYGQLGRFYFDQGKNKGSYSFRLNAKTLDTLRDALEPYGLSIQSCTRTIDSYELK